MDADKKKGCGCALWGGGLAGIVAAILSYYVNHSLFWALAHFVCSGFYIIYWLFAHLPDLV